MPRLSLLFLPITLLTLSCSPTPTNPSFPLTVSDARSALSDMRRHPVPLTRPLLIVSGYLEPGIVPPSIQSSLSPLFSPADSRLFLTASLATAANFDDCRAKLIKEVDTRFPNTDPTQTTQVDVIAFSMGGLASRYAATPLPNQRRLHIARLFTIASPLRGAQLAPLPTLSKLQIDMRPGSPFLQSLPPAPDYEIIPYTRLDDELVGPANTSLPNTNPWWLPNLPFQSSHLLAYSDPRILADIARRLRRETPFTHPPPAPLPE